MYIFYIFINDFINHDYTLRKNILDNKSSLQWKEIQCLKKNCKKCYPQISIGLQAFNLKSSFWILVVEAFFLSWYF